ncbi:TetR/AcrR family transcriptional regulator [Litorihabitans aurantiacus]|uniref:TetR family transcriptional regulator n=1 Tax=Litorihabitans aurantiacus TaxID=1930061 RepID=A0AA37UN58_9MICO|nr:TetR/AcrR family transcriptional regulator [Litorihabitans aurantiacus]GMA31069.1 TetR family transcriptional regulator [Litorihabitans aurantiacus]
MPGPRRDAARTRARLLEAAGGAISRQGVNVSLDVIARSAGVSKGGLLHHFPTREELLVAVMRHLLAEFDAAVEHALLAEPEGEPGRLARAYVAAVFDDLADGERAREKVTLMGMIGSSPGVEEHVRMDDEAWRVRLEDDGLDPVRVQVVTKAADGATGALLWSRTDAGAYDELRRTLIAMTRTTGPLLP